MRILAKTKPIALNHLAVFGHSAGAHAALWLASRANLQPTSDIGSRNPPPIEIVIAIDGPAELAAFVGFDADICGKPVIAPLMGGLPKEQARRYRLATPIENLPVKTREYLVASLVFTVDAAQRYRSKALSKGQSVKVLDVKDGGHFDIIAPSSTIWKQQVAPFLAKTLNSANEAPRQIH